MDETATINHAVSPGYGATAASVSVTVEDDETAAIVIDADPSTATVVDSGPIALAEGATSTTPYTVRLSAQPTGTVTVTVTSADAAAATADTDPATGLQNTLSFTTGNWDTARTAWLTPVDDTDPNSEEVEIRHEANGGGYNGVFAILRADVAERRRGRDRGHGPEHARRPVDRLVAARRADADVPGAALDAAGGRQRDGDGDEQQRGDHGVAGQSGVQRGELGRRVRR